MAVSLGKKNDFTKDRPFAGLLESFNPKNMYHTLATEASVSKNKHSTFDVG